MKLYHSPGACSQAPHIALLELGLEFDGIPVDLATHTLPDGSDFRRINPKGYVPVLELDDGSRLTEAGVILQYIADRQPSSLAPPWGTLERYRLMEWLSFIATELHKGFGPLWNPQTPPEVRTRAIAALGNRFAFVSDALARSEYLMGRAYTIADVYLFVILGWTWHHQIALDPWPALVEFRERVATRPAVLATLKAEGLAK